MNIERALAPLAVVIAVLALAVWLMLANDIVLGPWLLAALVFAHGWVHLMFVFPKPDSSERYASGYPFEFGRSWLFRRAGLELGLVRGIGLVLMVIVFGLSVLAALSTVGILVPADWWAGVMMATAAASSVMLALFYSPALILGFAIDALMMVLVVSGTWSPA